VGAECNDFRELRKELFRLRERQQLIEAAFESAYEGIVLVDPDGKIVMLNDTYAKFLQVDAREVIGRHVTEVIENTRMHIVVRTGRPELAQVQRIRGGDMLVHRIPIRKNNQVVSAVGKVLFQDVNKLHALSRRVMQLSKELDYYREEYFKKLGIRYRFDDIAGKSEAMLRMKEMARKVAWSDSTVFIGGESGTGKEMFAHAIHFESPRREKPFIKVNCAAIPESLMESILFGYEEGAFTGASPGGRKGKFLLAEGGTIFLDEIGELPLTMQAKLLRVLQEKEVEPVGSAHPVPVNVRVLAASNRDLEEMVREKRFRLDLFYRLHVISLQIPPLRKRKEDIPELAQILLKELSAELGIYASRITPEAMGCLLNYDWPGNVRELRNVLERSMHLMDGDTLDVKHLPYHLQKNQGRHDGKFSLKSVVAQAEKEAIRQALKAANGNRNLAIQMLGISRSGFYDKLKKYKLI
jgi:PAS domain S-box-containing protein